MVDHVVDVGREVDLWAHEVNPLTDPGEARREHGVAHCCEQEADIPPSVSAAPTRNTLQHVFDRGSMR